ncbi:hypothetical protein LXL04_025480 [Taraxacum kok-saghyz]
MKSRFKNDSNNAVDVDDDDDFVTPPRGDNDRISCITWQSVSSCRVFVSDTNLHDTNLVNTNTTRISIRVWGIKHEHDTDQTRTRHEFTRINTNKLYHPTPAFKVCFFCILRFPSSFDSPSPTPATSTQSPSSSSSLLPLLTSSI